MSDFLKSTLAKCVGGVLGAILLLFLGGVGSSVKEKYFPTTEYVNQQVNDESAAIIAKMRMEDERLKKEFKEGIQIMADEIHESTGELTAAVKELKDVQQGTIIHEASIEKDLDFIKKRVEDGENERVELEKRIRAVER